VKIAIKEIIYMDEALHFIQARESPIVVWALNMDWAF